MKIRVTTAFNDRQNGYVTQPCRCCWHCGTRGASTPARRSATPCRTRARTASRRVRPRNSARWPAGRPRGGSSRSCCAPCRRCRPCSAAQCTAPAACARRGNLTDRKKQIPSAVTSFISASHQSDAVGHPVKSTRGSFETYMISSFVVTITFSSVS